MAAALTLILIWSRLFRAHFSTILFVILIIGGLSKTAIISSNGVGGEALYVIIVFFIMRSRFFTSLIVCLIDILFYDLYLGLNGKITFLNICFINFLQFFLLGFAAYHAYLMERGYRIDFLLQKDYNMEKSRTQKIVDNMLPPYVTRKMKLNQGRNEIIGTSYTY